MNQERPRLIDANALLARKWDWCDAEDAIRNAPTVDAEPVRHAHWILHPEIAVGDPDKECSACGAMSLIWSHYCHACGAKMDEEENT